MNDSTTHATLVLADGSRFSGESVGAPGRATGEVVFNTAMSGYQEILTDPSYRRQIITLTYPHIGNVGVNDDDCESASVHASGLVVRDVPPVYSNWRATGGLRDWLHRHGVVAIAGIDTRRLTRVLRERGAQGGCIVAASSAGSETPTEAEIEAALAAARDFPGLAGMDLAREVSVTAPFTWEGRGWSVADGAFPEKTALPSRFHVVAHDFGVKRNILRLLVERGCRVTVVPATHRASAVLALEPDGVFLSNGPGDPEPCRYAIDAIGRYLEVGIPTFGICLGHQLLALACGARTVKMKFGHHGANHPVQDLATGSVLITSQNHGFAVEESSLPSNLRPTHRSLFDGSLQGIHLDDRPAFGFQGHPEASPGPHEARHLFDHFVTLMAAGTGTASGALAEAPSGSV